MHDNARSHEANETMEYLHAEGIRKIKFPSMFPDLNPRENL